MAFEQDYMKRLAQSIGKMIVAITEGKNAIESNVENDNFDMKLSEDDLLEIMVKKYVDEGNLNKAEDAIFNALESHYTTKSYKTALEFYKTINESSDEKLKNCNFERSEIEQGIDEVQRKYNKKIS